MPFGMWNVRGARLADFPAYMANKISPWSPGAAVSSETIFRTFFISEHHFQADAKTPKTELSCYNVTVLTPIFDIWSSYCEHSGVCVLTNKNNPTCTKLGWKREKTDKYLKKAHPLNVSGYKKKLPILSHLPFWILRRPLWICRLLLRKSLSERQRNLCHQREPNSCRVLEYW